MSNISTVALKLPLSHKYVINHILRKFICNSYIDSVFLFGSCAKGVANENSDIDLFVVTNSKVKSPVVVNTYFLLFSAHHAAISDISASCSSPKSLYGN